MENYGKLDEWEGQGMAEGIDLESEIEELLPELPSRSNFEEQLNTWSHGLGAVLAAFGAFYLVFIAVQSEQSYALESALVYGATMILLFGASASYHGVTSLRLKRKLRILDHCAIFLFIAGNYTPLLLLTIGGKMGWSLFTFQWSIALVGTLLKIKFTGRYDWFFILMFVAMAWIGVLQGDYLYHALPIAGFSGLVIGGLVYMVGIVFYKSEERIPYAHLVWHLFVMAGCSIHYYMIVRYVFI
ncbi:MAG: PAQR family membrane homeostasis protein TrhA [Aureispira sp.]